MKKLLLLICIVALAAVLLSAVGGKKQASADGEPRFTTVSEAAFSMRSSGSVDATSRLVGSYAGEHGEKLIFNGAGEVKRVLQNLSSVTGTYSLLQSTDGAAILDLDIAGDQRLYSFRLTSSDGAFTLTDPDGATRSYTPVPQ